MGSSEAKEIVIEALRANSRISLSRLSREAKIPLQALMAASRQAEDWVVRYACILEPRLIGYSIKVNFILKAKGSRIRDFLEKHPSINNCSRLMDEGLFYAECFFRDMKELDMFKDTLKGSGARILDEAFVTEELKREGFMCTG